MQLLKTKPTNQQTNKKKQLEMNQRAQSARGESGSHYFGGVQVFMRQTETRVETDSYIM